MSSLAQLRQELAARQDDRNVCDEMLALDPGSTDALETIPLLDTEIASLKAQIAAKEAEDNAALPPPPPPPMRDVGNSSTASVGSAAALATAPPPPPPPDDAQVFNVKDIVMAKWSEDKQWYQATIVSKTGSSADPVYKVTFKGYGNTETKRKNEVRVFHDTSKKRKVDESPTVPGAPSHHNSATAARSQNGAVISAAPAIDTTLVKKREPSKVSDGPTRMEPEPKKLKGSKQLDKAKSNWQDFQKTGPTKKGSARGGPKLGKDSQFRTPDLPNAKVGFTGSGKPMQKDPARSTWKYGRTDDDDD